MINNEKIVTARVIARMEEFPDLPECNYEEFCRNYRGRASLKLRKWREFEIANQPIEEKIRLAKHHTQKIHNDIKAMLEIEFLNSGKDLWQDIRALCSGIENYPDQILNRLTPVFVALDSLDPSHQLRREFGPITEKFKTRVGKIRNDFPNGKGVYQKRLSQLVPAGQKYLRECFNVTDKLIQETFK